MNEELGMYLAFCAMMSIAIERTFKFHMENGSFDEVIACLKMLRSAEMCLNLSMYDEWRSSGNAPFPANLYFAAMAASTKGEEISESEYQKEEGKRN